MPELPEVETIRRDLIAVILHKKITAIDIYKPKLVRNGVKKFKQGLIDQQFTDIGRIGKLMYFHLPRKKYLLVHLKMTGQLIYQEKNELIAGGHNWPPIEEKLPNKYSHIIFTFTDKSQLFFNDQRQFGYMEIVGQVKLDKIIADYGIEPLTENFIFDDFNELLKDRQASIKSILLNQKIIAGIGNIYADEILHASGIRPNKSVRRISTKNKQEIFHHSNAIISQAIKYRGTTFNNYRDPKGKKGNFVSQLKVYGREGEKCGTCGIVIVRKKFNGRSAHYCPKCQK